MKAILLISLFLAFSASAGAFAEEIAEPAQQTAADAAAVRACFGGCEKDNNQTNLTTSPYEVDQKYNEIMKIRSKDVITPEQLQKGKGTKEQPMDI